MAQQWTRNNQKIDVEVDDHNEVAITLEVLERLLTDAGFTPARAPLFLFEGKGEACEAKGEVVVDTGSGTASFQSGVTWSIKDGILTVLDGEHRGIGTFRAWASVRFRRKAMA